MLNTICEKHVYSHKHQFCWYSYCNLGTLDHINNYFHALAKLTLHYQFPWLMIMDIHQTADRYISSITGQTWSWLSVCDMSLTMLQSICRASVYCYCQRQIVAHVATVLYTGITTLKRRIVFLWLEIKTLFVVVK